MSRHIAVALFSVSLVLVLGGASAVQAQSVPASFFGASSDVCVRALVTSCTLGSGGTGLYPVWWPGSSSDTSPARIAIGAAGKPVGMGWGMAEIDVTSLYIAPAAAPMEALWVPTGAVAFSMRWARPPARPAPLIRQASAGHH